jgi:acetoacetyl-CoA synthetase
LSSITGGTDIMGCFALGNPTLPVYSGEFNRRGSVWLSRSSTTTVALIPRGKGELVCTRPFPSMPIGFLNDPDGARYRAAYFERFPGVWHHGDYGEFTEHDGVVIHGRSDAVLNRGGVRIGTAEIYRQMETIDQVLECIAIGSRRRGRHRSDSVRAPESRARIRCRARKKNQTGDPHRHESETRAR